MGDLAVISRHEKGFWQGDLYVDASHLSGDEMEQMGLAPDAFFTLGRGSTEDEARIASVKAWPAAVVVVADDEEDSHDR